MKRSREKPLDAAELRRRAEKRLKASKKQEAPPRTEEETQRILHELQVHQIELEMQNEEMRQARAEVEAGLERYKDLYDFAPVGYVTLGRDGTIRQVNLTGARLLGVERARLVNRRFGRFVSDDSHSAFAAFLQKVFANQAKESCEVALLKEGNHPFCVRIEATVSEDGQECRAVVADITERKQAEEALRESNAFNTMLLQTMPVGMDIVDEQGHVLFLSPAMERAMGKQAIGELCWHLYKDDQQQCADCPLKQQISVGKTQSLESAGVLGGKTVEISHTGMIYRGKKALLEVFYDITERKQMEGALQEAEQKYRGIFENAVEGIFQSTPDGRFLTANPVFARMFGYQTPEELVSTITDIPTQLYVNPEDRQSFQQLLEKFGFVEAFETELYHKDGRKIWISINTRAVKDENGTVRYYEGMVEEITARKQAEEKLQARYNELQSLNKIGYIILTSSDFKSALARVLSEILPACSLDLGVVRLLDAKSQNLEPIASLGFNDLEDENMLRSAYLERGRDPTVDHVLTEKKTVVLENLRERDALRIMQREGIQSAILVPIKTEQQILGILQVGNRATREFQPDEIRLLEGVGNLIGIGVQKARLYEETQRNLERIRALHEIDLAITSTLDLRTILDMLLEKIDLFLPYSAATIRLWNERTRLLEPVACRNINEGEWKAEEWKGGRGSPNIAFETKATISIANCQTDPRVRDHEFFRKHSLVSYVGVPLIVHDRILGVISFYTTTKHEFTSEEIGFLGTLASQAAIAINNSQTYEEVKTSRKELELTNQYLDKSLRLLSGLYTALTPLTTSESVREMMDGIIERLMEATGADAALIRLQDKEKGGFYWASQRGFPESYLKAAASPPPGSALEQVFNSGEPVIAPDIASNSRLKRKHQLEVGLRSYAMLPLKVHDEVRGLIHLASRKPGYFDEEQSDHLMAIARQMGIALENRELFDGLKASRNELEKANKIKDEFLSIMSHELRTPLNVVVGYTGMIKDGLLGEINPQQQEALGKVISRANDQLVLINNILYATVLDTEKINVDRHEVSLGDFLNQLKLGYDAPINKDLTFKWDYSPDLPAIKTDSAKLKQLMQNLIDNGIKFTDKGCVTISAQIRQQAEGNRQQEEGLLTPRSTEAHDRSHASRLTPSFVEFKVADTGFGIPKDALPFIFYKFRQVDSSETRSFGGVGMGLYIVKRFAELLGGRVDVESEVEKGSTFTVTLPCGQ